MLEVEAKYPVAEFTPAEARLRAWGAALLAEQAEADHYLNAPDRDFARTDEALRLRRVGRQNLLTYKGPRHVGPAKSRTELEIPCPPGDEGAESLLKLFRHLGYQATAVVRKKRRIYELARDGFTLHACLDDVEEVGRFVELEVIAEEANLDAARQTVLRTAAELQLGPPESRSYLEQLLGQAGPPAAAG
jgi:adenylate cyclase, class 2